MRSTDYVVAQRVLSAQLRKGGYEITTAGSGFEALTYFTARRFDLAIIDVAMPNVDGTTLLEKLRHNSNYQNLPIIMLIASVLDEDRIKGSQQPMTPYIYMADGKFRAAVRLAAYVTLSDKWQPVAIPLQDFAVQGVDLGALDRVGAVWEYGSGSGTLWLDNITS